MIPNLALEYQANLKLQQHLQHIYPQFQGLAPLWMWLDRLDHLKPLLSDYPPDSFDNTDTDALLARVGIRDQQGNYPHPFQDVLDGLEYLPSQLQPGSCKEPEPLDWTPFLYVDTQEGLDKMAGQLKGEEEIAVDLEAHQFRSFQGLTCLMQVGLWRAVPSLSPSHSLALDSRY